MLPGLGCRVWEVWEVWDLGGIEFLSDCSHFLAIVRVVEYQVWAVIVIDTLAMRILLLSWLWCQYCCQS